MRTLSVLLFSLGITISASAQTDSDPTFITPFDSICTTKEIFAETIAKYGEVPIMRGVSLRNVNGALVPMNTVLFMNIQTGSWTMAEKMSEEAFCVVAMGRDWHVYPGASSEKIEGPAGAGRVSGERPVYKTETASPLIWK